MTRINFAFLGPLGTYSHQAVLEFAADHPAELYPTSTIRDACVTGVVHGCSLTSPPYVVIFPIENSNKGRVIECVNCLASASLFGPGRLVIIGEYHVAVRHALVVHSTNNSANALEVVRTVRSHPQALAQCSKFLSQLLPKAERVATNSTAEAVALLDEFRGDVAVASELAAHLAGAKVIQRNIQDSTTNVTRFVVATCLPDDPAVTALLAHSRKVNHTSPLYCTLVRIVVPESASELKAKIHSLAGCLHVQAIDDAKPLDGPDTEKVMIIELHSTNPSDADVFVEQLSVFIGRVDKLGTWLTHVPATSTKL